MAPEEHSTFIYDASFGAPKYLQLANWLDKWIAHKGFTGGDRLPSDRQLSRKFGLSTLTVNRGLNELATRGLIDRRVGSGTYVASRRPETSRTPPVGIRRVGILCHEELNEDECYITILLRTLSEAASAHDWDLLRMVRPVGRFLSVAREYQLAGVVVIAPPFRATSQLREILDHRIPFVIVGVAPPGLESRTFGTDHRKIARDSTRYFVAKGHRAIGLLHQYDWDDNEAPATIERRSGYLEGMWEARLPINPRWQITSQRDNAARLEEDLGRLRADGDLPTALLVSQHSDIPMLYGALERLGIRVPEDLSLLAFDAPSYTERLTPPLTVWRQEVAAFARAAAEALERQIAGLDFTCHIGAAHLIERASCGTRPDAAATPLPVDFPVWKEA